jgi:Cu+-exporting ATPase
VPLFHPPLHVPLLEQVADAIHLSRRTLAKIKQNLVWAFGYNLISIPLAAGALLPSLGICLTPSISGALMGMSSVMVVGNSLLLQLEMHKAFDEAAARRMREAAGSGLHTGGRAAAPAAGDAAPIGAVVLHVEPLVAGTREVSPAGDQGVA